MTQRFQTVRPTPGSALLGLLVAGLFLYLLFRLAAFTLDALFSGLPVFFGLGVLLAGGAYLVDARVPRGFVAWLGGTFRARPLRGVLLAAAATVFAPFVGGYLLAKAVLLRKVRERFGEAQARAAEYARERGAGEEIGGAGFGGSRTGSGDDYTEVRRDDGLVIRIPREGGEG